MKDATLSKAKYCQFRLHYTTPKATAIENRQNKSFFPTVEMHLSMSVKKKKLIEQVKPT